MDVRRATTEAASFGRDGEHDLPRKREGGTGCHAVSQLIGDSPDEVAASGRRSGTTGPRRKNKRDVASGTGGRHRRGKDREEDGAAREDTGSSPPLAGVQCGLPVTGADREEHELPEATEGGETEIDSSSLSTLRPRPASLSLAVSETGLVLLHFIADWGAEFLCTGLGLVFSDGAEVQGGLPKHESCVLRCPPPTVSKHPNVVWSASGLSLAPWFPWSVLFWVREWWIRNQSTTFTWYKQ